MSNEMIRWINQRMENASGRACGIAGSVSEDLFLKSATALLDEMSDNYARDDEAGLGDPEAERLRLSEAAAQYRVRAEAYHERALPQPDEPAVSIGPLTAGLGQACFSVRAGGMVLSEVMTSC
ncbi:hypothetical protein SAMN05878503_12329 [Cereibacter ovatus]|uniref:Uncharacterized protein n=1 Tax=Cereibacter ovatus TaxID=439529 RepID=A0A285D5I2_9RHOB|nr:hypothetical protein [Cereibacter ovatus]SNX74538.1 hypothetical protein SAMN05878503_12329 [Cereibacter ovatus]